MMHFTRHPRTPSTRWSLDGVTAPPGGPTHPHENFQNSVRTKVRQRGKMRGEEFLLLAPPPASSREAQDACFSIVNDANIYVIFLNLDAKISDALFGEVVSGSEGDASWPRRAPPDPLLASVPPLEYQTGY